MHPFWCDCLGKVRSANRLICYTDGVQEYNWHAVAVSLQALSVCCGPTAAKDAHEIPAVPAHTKYSLFCCCCGCREPPPHRTLHHSPSYRSQAIFAERLIQPGDPPHHTSAPERQTTDYSPMVTDQLLASNTYIVVFHCHTPHTAPSTSASRPVVFRIPHHRKQSYSPSCPWLSPSVVAAPTSVSPPL